MSNLKLNEFRKTVTTAGSAVQLSLTTLKAQDILITADPDNSGTVYIGSASVSASSKLGIPLVANESVTLPGTEYQGVQEKFDMSLIYVDSNASGDTVIVSYYDREID